MSIPSLLAKNQTNIGMSGSSLSFPPSLAACFASPKLQDPKEAEPPDTSKRSELKLVAGTHAITESAHHIHTRA